MRLQARVRAAQKSKTAADVKAKLASFAKFRSMTESKWFSELCFCILAANAKGKVAFEIQEDLGDDCLFTSSKDEVCDCIRKHRHRFHNNKASYIVDARRHVGLKSRILDEIASGGEAHAREWLVHNVKGIGYKEASHFLRNTGCMSLAILDRHILNLLAEERLIERPKSLTKKKYLEIEKVFQDYAIMLRMSPAELDLYLWSMKTGYVLK
jgi:N-glycosylase/DNA lyase